MIISAAVIIVLISIDQITKIFAASHNVNMAVIPDLLYFRYAENKGAAFSFLDNQAWAPYFFICTAFAAAAAFIFALYYFRKRSKFLNITLALIIAGTIGNLLDRLFLGYVRDFIAPSFFANFNIADSCLVIGCFMLIFYMLFLDNKKNERVKSNNTKK